mmetsp:Transcript_19482/g.24039  ORF Transcript_19482/g.24039 Transcript_19482/m.24039 type:complete len:201 (-) Transcript_19482:2456-3058(-)
MSKNIFINNLDTYVSQAIFKELRNDQLDDEGNKPDNANLIFGTYIGKDSSANPEGVKKMLKRSKPNLAMTYISKCDLIVYDLHSGNPEDVQLALDAMNKPRTDDDPGQEKILILISSLLAWDATPRNLEEIISPKEQEEMERAAKEAELAAARAAQPESPKAEGEAEEEAAEEETSLAREEAVSPGLKSAAGEGAAGEEG